VAAEKGVEVTARDQQAKGNVSEKTKVAQPVKQKATPVPSTESVPNNSEIQDVEATLKELHAQDVELALTLGPKHPDRLMVAAKIRRAEGTTMKRLREPPVIDPDAPTVTVVDFDKTATYDQPMHFRVIVTGSIPVPTLTVALRRIESPETRAFHLSSPTGGFNSSSKVADARTLTDFTILPKCMGNCDISLLVKDEQGRVARWVAGTVVVKPADVK
jgi:hypothetical protein